MYAQTVHRMSKYLTKIKAGEIGTSSKLDALNNYTPKKMQGIIIKGNFSRNTPKHKPTKSRLSFTHKLKLLFVKKFKERYPFT